MHILNSFKMIVWNTKGDYQCSKGIWKKSNFRIYWTPTDDSMILTYYIYIYIYIYISIYIYLYISIYISIYIYLYIYLYIYIYISIYIYLYINEVP